MRTIIFYGYKGGSGRTMAVAHVARYLAELGQQVVAIDLDLEAPGLPTRLRPTVRADRGFVDLVLAFLDSGQIPALDGYLLPVEDTWSRLDQPSTGTIRILPAGGPVGPVYWEKLTRINWQSLFSARDAGPLDAKGVAFLLALKDAITNAGADYLLIDSRTGISELGGRACTLLADDMVCLCIPNLESIKGTREVLATLRSAPRLPRMAPLHILPVLSRVPDFVLDSKYSPSAAAHSEGRLLALVMDGLHLEVGPHVDKMVIVHSVPSMELDERIFMDESLVGERPPERGAASVPLSESLGGGRLFADYMALFRRLVPGDVLDNYLRKLVGEVQMRAYKAPAVAQEELRAIAFQYRDAHSLRAYLELCRLRERLDADVLEAARNLVAATDDPAEELVWDIVARFIEREEGDLDEYEEDTVQFCTRVWLARGDRAPGMIGLRLLSALAPEKQGAELVAGLVEALTARASRGDTDVAIGLARYFTEQSEGERAITLLQRMTNLRSLPVQRAWTRAVLSLGRRESAHELLDNTSFSEESIRGEPRLWVDLHRLAGRLDDGLARISGEIQRIAETGSRGGLSPKQAQTLREARELFVMAGRTEELFRITKRMGISRHPEHARVLGVLDVPAITIED